MTDPSSRFDAAPDGDELGARELLEDLRLMHAAERAPEAFKHRVIRAACERAVSAGPIEVRSVLEAFVFNRISTLREALGRSLATIGRIDVRWAHFGLALGTLAVIGVARELWDDPDAAIVPLAEPSTQSHAAPAAGTARSSSVALQMGAACPQAIYPLRPPFDPASTDAGVREAGVTLHTFLQETRSCGQVTRRYLEYVPPGRSASHAPVVLILHGSRDRAEGMRQVQTRERFEALARRDGFIAVYASAVPASDSDPNVPNVGRWQLEGELERQVDDLGYLERIVRDMQRRGVIAGNNRVLLVGHAEGATLALHAAAQRPDLYSGVAAVMPAAAIAAPRLEADAKLSRVLFISLGDDMRAAVHDWALSLGITHKAIEAARAVNLVDRASEGRDHASVALRSRSSRVRRVDIETSDDQGAKIRALFVSENAGRFVPMPGPDRPELAADFGFRNQDIDSAEEAWSFLRGALDG